MSHRIIVVQDSASHRWKVLINYIQRGPELSNCAQANKEAQHIHATEMPHASLQLGMGA